MNSNHIIDPPHTTIKSQSAGDYWPSPDIVSGAYAGASANAISLAIANPLGVRCLIKQVYSDILTAGGQFQVFSKTITHKSDASDNCVFTLTAAGMSNSPKAITVALLNTDDTPTKVAAKVMAAINLDADASAWLVCSVSGAELIFTLKSKAANDGTAAFVVTNAGTTAVTAGAGTHTTAGIAIGTLDIGVAADAATASDTLIDGVSAAIGVTNSVADKGINGSGTALRVWGATQYVTVKVVGTNAPEISGNLYVEYIKL